MLAQEAIKEINELLDSNQELTSNEQRLYKIMLHLLKEVAQMQTDSSRTRNQLYRVIELVQELERD